jgi:DNA-binding MarR family transcriptional regulator/GNAT superfamily N-acetyltransferase
MAGNLQKTGARRREVALVREFNRFYTRQIGVLQEGLLASPFSLTELRLIYELSVRENCTASQLAQAMGIDRGYLSRILRRFQSRGHVQRKRSATDGRQLFLILTSKGRSAYAPLNARANAEVAHLLKDLPRDEMRRLLDSMHTIRYLLSSQVERITAYVLRPPQPGDYGWVVSAHGDLCARERGWNEEIEALAAELVADFIRGFNPRYDRCWIAECEGNPVGSALVAKRSKAVAELLLLLVVPRARRLGIGSRLLTECCGFARQAGYGKLRFRVQGVLDDKRKLLRRADFRLVGRRHQQTFGRAFVEETWELRL